MTYWLFLGYLGLAHQLYWDVLVFGLDEHYHDCVTRNGNAGVYLYPIVIGILLVVCVKVAPSDIRRHSLFPEVRYNELGVGVRKQLSSIDTRRVIKYVEVW